MSQISRNITRVIYNSTEVSNKMRTPSGDTIAFNITTADALYVGYQEKFSTRHFGFGVANTNALTVSVKYWNGTSFVAVEDLVDQTNGLKNDGFISWANQGDWKLKAQTPVEPELYWVKIEVSANASAPTTLDSVLNIFCDDFLLRSYYPELITDSRFLPAGRTDFLEQYVAAKELVVLRLKQDGIIREESQIIDVNEVANAAVHATAWIILNPISLDAENRVVVDRAFDNFTRELNRVKLDLDFDKDGIIEEQEENKGNFFIARG
jgi:hypothetical protein